MQNLENLDVFEILITQKTAKMPEGPFCQIGAHLHVSVRSFDIMVLFILTHTSNAKSFRNVTLINIRGLAVIIAPFRGYSRLSPNQVMIKRE